ncbi:MAG: 50S ribosomal protein L23 [Bacteroidia bacterium]|nr:50S ribosomal protein L23 [Bacteroidia bacterium]
MSIIIKPIQTEKTTKIGQKHKKYVFEVGLSANKIEIRKAIETMFGVIVESVQTNITIGKSRSRMSKRGFIQGKSSNRKKATITLKEGQEINFNENLS